MEVSGRTSVGTSVVSGLNIPLGEDLKVGDGLDAYSRLGGFCGGKPRPERVAACQGLPGVESLRHRESEVGRLQ